jgi:hypothetical protein
MREVRFATVDEFDAWVKEAAIKLRVPASTMELWENIKKAVRHLYNAAMWGLDAHPSHCQYDMMVAQDALRPYECEDEQKEGCTMLQEQLQQKSQQRTFKWAVVHLIHVRTPHQHIPRLFITEVPEHVSAGTLKDLLECAGYYFGEFGIAWANHYLSRHDKWDTQVIGTYNRVRRNPADYDVPIISYDELVRQAQLED